MNSFHASSSPAPDELPLELECRFLYSSAGGDDWGEFMLSKSSTPVRVRLLGDPKVEGCSENLIFPSKGFQLLTLLACHEEHRLRRREIARLLWDSDTEKKALANLRQLLARIRKGIPEIDLLISASGSEIRLGYSSASVDVCAFTDLAAKDSIEELETALELFRGDLLSSMDDITDEFVEWLNFERSRLRGVFFEAMSRVLMQLTRYGRAPKNRLDALAAQLIRVEPEREISYRLLIETYGRNGMLDRAEAVRHDLTSMLAREHEATPSAQTQAVIRKVFSLGLDSAPIVPSTGSRGPKRIAFLAPKMLGKSENALVLKALIEDVVNQLTRYRSFVALAPHSSFQIDHESGMPRDNSKLRADYSISGFVKPDGQQNQLTLRMVNCASGDIAWSGEFALSQAHLVDSFTQLTVRVAASLASSIERAMLDDMRASGDAGAYYHYLEGQSYLEHCDLPNVRRARKSFARAIADEGEFASAHARFAQTLYLEWLMRGANIPEIVVAAQTSARRACDIDPNGSLGHFVGAIIALYQREFDEAVDGFTVAEDLNPHSAELLAEYAHALSLMGDNDAGIERFSQAIDLNPMPPDHYWWAGASIQFNAGNLPRAIEMCGYVENQETVLRLLTACHALNGDQEQARSCGRRLREIYPDLTAADMVGISPDANPDVSRRFIEGLRMAGID